MGLPRNIFTYTDCRDYLNDYFSTRKNKRGGLSLRQFSRRAGFKSSGYISLLMCGRRHFTPYNITRFVNALGLTGNEAKYFDAMAKCTEAKDIAERNLYLGIMDSFKPRKGLKGIKKDQYEFLSRSYYLVLHQLVALPDFREDPKWVSSRLRVRLTSEQVDEAFELMLRLKLLVRNEEGKLTQTDKSLTTDSNVYAKEAYRFYWNLFDETKQALIQVPPELREMGSLTLPIPLTCLDELRTKITQFMDEVQDWASRQQGSSYEIFHVNAQMYPATK